ncbi:MAG: HupE/UreJ family protein [Xanthobacteraceae bacterium]|nr:HupE/UreJ family protein [Xanthobacteraceae bacterium]
MKFFARALIALALIVAAEPALAHPPPLGVRGFWGGVLHPVFVTDHVVGILGLGLLIGGQERWGWLPPAACVAALGAGLAAMTAGIVPRFANEAVLGTAVVAGLLAALARPLPQVLGAVLALVLGLAVALDSPPEVLSVSEANLMLIGTGIGAASFLIVVALASRQAQARWARIGVRILGSWIAAAAILALALRFAR